MRLALCSLVTLMYLRQEWFLEKKQNDTLYSGV